MASETHLPVETWIAGDKSYKINTDMINSCLEQAFINVDRFFIQFEPILFSFWENKQAENLYSILENDNLIRPGDVL